MNDDLPPTQSDAERALRRICQAIEARFDLSEAALLGRRRNPVLDRARLTLMGLAYDMIKSASQREIAELFKRNGATIRYAVRTVNESKELRALHAEIKREIEHDDAFRAVR